jgi:hypothetical protein
MFAFLLPAKEQHMRLCEPQSHFRHGVKKNAYSAIGVPTPDIQPKVHCTDLAITANYQQIHNTYITYIQALSEAEMQQTMKADAAA